MICPFRKRTQTVNGITSEYYMECYGTECPYYVAECHFSGDLETPPYCNRADTEMFLATHPSYMKGGAE
jgi:hypothetical protein